MLNWIDGKEFTGARRRQYIWIWIIGIWQYLRGDKDTMQPWIVFIMTHVMPVERKAVSVKRGFLAWCERQITEIDLCDNLISHRADYSNILVVRVCIHCFIWISRSTGVGHKNLMINRII